MFFDIVKKGSTDRSVTVTVLDSTDGTPETGVAYNTAGIDLWYRREGATKTSITEATLATTDAAHSDGGFIHIANGVCRLDLPDAAFATGANYVDFGGTITGMVVIGGRVRLANFDLETATVGITNGTLTSSTYDGSTAYPVTQADTGSSALARTGADGDTLETLSDQIDAVSAQVSGIGSGTGAALNFEVVGDNASAPLNGVTKVGTPTGTFANTLADDGTTHQIASDGNAIDWVYQFSLGAARTASKLDLRANMSAVGDTVTVAAYNFSTTNWDTRTTITGTTETTYDVPLLSSHTGTGASEGMVYIRFTFSEADAGTLVIDQAYVQAQQSGSLVGYAMGAIWVDTALSNTNTVPYVDGTADNPVSTWAAAETLSGATGIHRFHIAGNSSITLTADSSSHEMIGDGLWTLALGGYAISNAYVRKAQVSGTGTGTNAVFEDCLVNAGTTVGPSYFVRCGFNTTSGSPFAAGAAGQYVFVDCVSTVAGSGTPYFNFAGTGSATGVNFRRWSGGSNITADSNVTTTMEVVTGGGQTVTTGGGNVEIRGICRAVSVVLTGGETVQVASVSGPITLSGTGTGSTVNLYGVHSAVANSATGSPTVNDYGSLATAASVADVPTVAEFEARTLAATSYFDPSTDKVTLANGPHGGASASLTLADYTDFQGSGASLTAQDVREEMDSNSTKLAAILEDTDSTIPAAISAISGGGAGAVEFTYTLTDADTSAAIPDVLVDVYSDVALTTFITNGRTDNSGQVTFYLQPDTYYLVRSKAGRYQFTNPDTEVVA